MNNMKNTVIVSTLGIIAALLFVSAMNTFFDRYRLRSPIVVRSPIEKRVSVIVMPTPTLAPKLEKKKQATPSGVIKPKKQAKFEPLKKYLTDEAYLVREKLIAAISVDYPNVDDQIAMDNIFKQESGYRPDAVNEIGACGMGQALPCSKMPCELGYHDEAVQCQYNWVKEYISRRYGTPSVAWDWHLNMGWY